MTDTDRYVVLTQSQAAVLRGLLRNQTQREIAEGLGMTQQAVSKVVSVLKAKGFIVDD